MRKYAAFFILAAMYIFYTVPLTLIAALAAPEKLQRLIPSLALLAHNNPSLNKLLQGVVPALLNSLFFALCPTIFKAISNFGSNAISVNQAEYIALQVSIKNFTSTVAHLYVANFSQNKSTVLLVFHGCHRFLRDLYR